MGRKNAQVSNKGDMVSGNVLYIHINTLVLHT